MLLKDKSILVVDDMKMVRARLKIILSELGAHEIQEAADGEQALEILKKSKVDLILSDWNMPKMNGINLLKSVRAEPSLEKIPVIFITSETQRAQMVEALSAGANDYLVKPFSDEQVKQKVLAALKIKA